MIVDNIEMAKCEAYLARSSDEQLVGKWCRTTRGEISLLAAEGFEERALGFMRSVRNEGINVSDVALGRYTRVDANKKYREEFEGLAKEIAPKRWHILKNNNDHGWIDEALSMLQGEEIVLDVSGLSSQALFGALDTLSRQERPSYLAYSEAGEYRPRKNEWEDMLRHVKGDVDEDSLLAEVVDEKPWLYGGAYDVELISGHEGYDATDLTALVAFLPFKPGRLAALLAEQDYASYLFIAGQPRLAENSWRFEAISRINAMLIEEWQCIEMPTFGYRESLRLLARQICSERGLLERFDVHLAPLGSKLQNVACWALSKLVPPITLRTSVAQTYYPEAFSEGVGETWAFPLTKPDSAA